MKKIAIVLFNLGGPDNQEAVQPFLFNLFNDPSIITLPNPFRYLLAKFISKKRAPVAKEIYQHLGGGSPILHLTENQASSLEKKLNDSIKNIEFKVFTVMRYWHPRAKYVSKKIEVYHPDEIILLPLYPQFSTTTSGSSLNEWKEKAGNIKGKVKTVGCYPTHDLFISAHAESIKKYYDQASEIGKPRILFSAHGLPKKIIEKGDPYQWQVEQTADAIIKKMDYKTIDYTVCYQSKVGRLEWLTPSTEEEIKRAGEDNVPLVIVPIAFVSEHSETLVELDIEYKQLADDMNVPGYFRVAALGDNDIFIASLTQLCFDAMASEKNITSCEGKRLCPPEFSKCICV